MTEPTNPTNPTNPTEPTPSLWPGQAATPAQPGMGVQPGMVVAAPATSSNAIVALVLSICSWVIIPFVLGWIFAVIALVFAGKASKEIVASGGVIPGQGFVTAARIVSWINIGVTAAVAVLTIVVIAIVIAAGALSVA